jgi:hypothetical protein
MTENNDMPQQLTSQSLGRMYNIPIQKSSFNGLRAETAQSGES